MAKNTKYESSLDMFLDSLKTDKEKNKQNLFVLLGGIKILVK